MAYLIAAGVSLLFSFGAVDVSASPVQVSTYDLGRSLFFTAPERMCYVVAIREPTTCEDLARAQHTTVEAILEQNVDTTCEDIASENTYEDPVHVCLPHPAFVMEHGFEDEEIELEEEEGVGQEDGSERERRAATTPVSIARRLVCLTNLERQKRGLPALGLDTRLTSAAQRQSNDMARTGRVSHIGSDGSQIGDRVSATGYFWFIAGENIAAYVRTPEEVVKGWMNSPGHKANILGREYTHFGGAVAFGRNGAAYWTQVFAGNGQGGRYPTCP